MTQNTEVADKIDAELDALIASATEETTEVVASTAADDAELEALEREIESDALKAAAYATQPAEEVVTAASLVASDDAAPTESTVTLIKSAGKSGAPKRPSEQFAKGLASHDLEIAAMLVTGDTADETTVNSVFDRIDKLAKKVGEKAANLLRNRKNPGKLQGYTREGLQVLIGAGEITSKDLFAHFSGKYKDGTARSQSNQLMQLFPALGVAERTSRSSLRINPDSLIVKDFQDASATA